MAEAFCKKYGGENFIAESAGLEPGTLNPYAVRAMAEVGIDISKNQTKSVFDFHKEGRFYHVVVTVCSKEAAERCPVFPGAPITLHWPFDDPSSFHGSDDEIMTKYGLSAMRSRKRSKNSSKRGLASLNNQM